MLDVDQKDESKWTPLHYAVTYYKEDCAALLVSRGAMIDMQDSVGRTAMDYALELVDGKEKMLAILKGRVEYRMF